MGIITSPLGMTSVIFGFGSALIFGFGPGLALGPRLPGIAGSRRSERPEKGGVVAGGRRLVVAVGGVARGETVECLDHSKHAMH